MQWSSSLLHIFNQLLPISFITQFNMKNAVQLIKSACWKGWTSITVFFWYKTKLTFKNEKRQQQKQRGSHEANTKVFLHFTAGLASTFHAATYWCWSTTRQWITVTAEGELVSNFFYAWANAGFIASSHAEWRTSSVLLYNQLNLLYCLNQGSYIHNDS